MGNHDARSPELPLVTCLCLTMEGRKEFLTRAVDCFLKQTYPFRELLIVADSIEQADVVFDSRGMVPVGMSISIYIPNEERLNIAQKRNLGCEAALNTDLIAVWDDDDFSASGRLAQQVEELRITSKAVTGYRSMKFTDGANWWKFSLPRGLVLGTSLCFTRDWWNMHPFPTGSSVFNPASQVGEDIQFAGEAEAAGQLAECPDLGLMYASIHPGNTSKRKTCELPWVPLPWFQWR